MRQNLPLARQGGQMAPETHKRVDTKLRAAGFLGFLGSTKWTKGSRPLVVEGVVKFRGVGVGGDWWVRG